MVTVQVSSKGNLPITVSPPVLRVQLGHPADLTCTYNATDANFYAIIWYRGENWVMVTKKDGTFTDTPEFKGGKAEYVNKGNLVKMHVMRIKRVERSHAGPYTCAVIVNDYNEWSLSEEMLLIIGKYKL